MKLTTAAGAIQRVPCVWQPASSDGGGVTSQSRAMGGGGGSNTAVVTGAADGIRSLCGPRNCHAWLAWRGGLPCGAATAGRSRVGPGQRGGPQASTGRGRSWLERVGAAPTPAGAFEGERHGAAGAGP